MNEATQTVVLVIEEAARRGSPVAGRTAESREKEASIAVRRLRSFDRRRRVNQPTREDRIEDLAKALSKYYDPNSSLVGPLIEDYRWLARRILDALSEAGLA